MLSGIHGNRRVTPGGISHVRPGAKSRDWNAVRILALGVIASDGLIETRIIREAGRLEVPGRLGHHIPELPHRAIRLRVRLIEPPVHIRQLIHSYPGQQLRMPPLLTPPFALHFFKVVAIRPSRVRNLMPLCHSDTLNALGDRVSLP